jgi:predicted DCC family thiol-disulfide oxidoreductase YuxK
MTEYSSHPQIQHHKLTAPENILFFDGLCGLCNRFVDLSLKYQKSPSLFYAPLQGKTAEKYLNSHERLDLDTVIFLREGKILKKSQAVFSLCQFMKFPLSILYLGNFIPVILADFVYDFIAKNRYSFWGKRDVCRLPTEKERPFFLD